MYPHERSLVKQLADKPFAIIGVNSDDDLDEIRSVVKEKNLTWRSFQNQQEHGDISSDWGIQGWPTIFVLDHEGKIRYRDVRGASMDKAIEELLGEMGHDVKITHDDEEESKLRKKKKQPSKKAPEENDGEEMAEKEDSSKDK